MEHENPESDLKKSIPVCSFEPSFVSKSLSFYHHIFAFYVSIYGQKKLVIQSFVTLHKNLKTQVQSRYAIDTLRLQMLAGTNFSEISEEPQIR